MSKFTSFDKQFSIWVRDRKLSDEDAAKLKWVAQAWFQTGVNQGVQKSAKSLRYFAAMLSSSPGGELGPNHLQQWWAEPDNEVIVDADNVQ